MKVAKKVALLVFIVFLLTASFALVFAQTSEEAEAETAETVESEKVALAYSWLSDQVKEGWPTSVEDNAFTLLALAYDDKLASEGRKTLLGKKTDGGWQGIKQTALALLALDRIGEKTTEIENWLLNKSQTFEATGLEWLIQIEFDGNTTCEISYGGKSESDEVTLYEDKKVKIYAKGSPRCLSEYPTDTPFWLKISPDEGCLKETYSFFCDDRVKASLLYKKGNTWFIPSETKELQQFDLKIESICLAEGGKCDYEGTLWAAYALAKQGRDVNLLLPYLVAQADIEDRYLPDAFLYVLTEDSGYADSLLALQDNKGYWHKMYKFYDTALAYLALKEYYAAGESLMSAKKYLLGNQAKTGSWGNSIRDTAFILYAIWPLEVSPMPPENECIAHDYSCRTSCIADDEVAAEEYSDFCEEDEICCKPVEAVTECSEEEHLCCKECDPSFEAYTDYDESCGLNKVCCEKCAAVAVPKCEEKEYKCCVECDPNSLDYPEYDESCPGFAICCEKCAEEIEICDNKIDDNGNNLIDCDDPDCVAFEKCQPKSKLWLFILLSIAVLIGLYILLRRRGFRPSEFFKRKLFRRFKRPPRFGEQPAQVLGRPRPMVLLRRPFKKPQPEATEKTETEEELEKTLSKLKQTSE